MKNIKLSGVFAIFLLILGCTALVAASTTNLTNDKNPVFAPLATGLPFSFSTPTPSPSPTPEPTVTPIPTPKPEPTAKPTLELHCTSGASSENVKVEVGGTLTYNKTAIPNASVYVGYSADGGNTWQNFSLAQTHVDGGFSAVWIPNATGNYLLCAQWEGNETLHWMNATATLALTPDSAGNLFSVASNSTVSNLNYNSETQKLSFNTNGTSSTKGYVQVCIPKNLVSDIQAVSLSIDGNSVSFTSESKDGVWVISCFYSQSEHAFSLQVPFMQVLSPVTTPWLTIIVVVAVLVALLAVAVVIRRRRRTAATVAAILKQNRPTY